MVQGVLGANVDFEIDISKKEDKLTKFGGAIKSGVLIQWQQTKVLRTRADLSYALVHNLELLTHFAKRAENERCFSRQNRDEKKTEMRKNIRVYWYSTGFSMCCLGPAGLAMGFDEII